MHRRKPNKKSQDNVATGKAAAGEIPKGTVTCRGGSTLLHRKPSCFPITGGSSNSCCSAFGCAAPCPQAILEEQGHTENPQEPSKHCSFVAIIAMARTRFSSAESQEQYFNNPHLGFVFSTSELSVKSISEALLKELARQCPRIHCSQSAEGHSQKEPGMEMGAAQQQRVDKTPGPGVGQ